MNSEFGNLNNAHAKAIAELIAFDIENAKRARPHWMFSALGPVADRAERRGFRQADIVRECVSRTVPGFGHAFPPAKRITAAMRDDVIAELTAAGIAAELVKISGAWCVKLTH